MWADSRIAQKRYRYCRQGKAYQKPDRAPAKTNRQPAARFYQLKTGHCLTGQFLKLTEGKPATECWRCSYQARIRGHIFSNCHRLGGPAEIPVGGSVAGG